MPNINAKVGAATSAYTAGSAASDAHKKETEALFSSIGTIMELPEGRRTSVFRTHKGDFHSAYSWYVRLREDRAQDPSFGLVRVEAKPGPDAIRYADAISAWILAERCPVSLPDGRWDRMIYPIRDCEQYLKAISPSQVEMEARLV